MFIRHYSEIALSGVLAIGIAMLCYSARGVPLLFDGFTSLAYLFFAWYFRENKDVMGVCIVLVLIQVIINSLFVFSADSYFWSIPCYLLTAVVVYQLWSDFTAKFVAVVLGLSLVSEIYWYSTGYDGPQVYFSFFKVSVFIIARFMLMYRPYGSKYFLSADTNAIRLDWKVHGVLGVSVLLELAYIGEYFVRHLTDLYPLYIYNAYPIITQALAVLYMWLISNQAVILIRKRTLTA